MLRAPLLADFPHGFTGRAEGDFARHPGERRVPESVADLLISNGAKEWATARQVHGARVVWAPCGDAEADAVVAGDPGVVVAVRVADCVPVLIASPAAVAAVHAGWRGTAADIVRAAVREMAEKTASDPGTFRAAIGPSIRGCCYAVGDEVRVGVGAVAPGDGWRVGANVDLAEANAAILREMGVAVDVVGPCTRCSPEYWSHRRDGEAAGRQVGFIGLPC
jgi:YfiH family protein